MYHYEFGKNVTTLNPVYFTVRCKTCDVEWKSAWNSIKNHYLKINVEKIANGMFGHVMIRTNH